MQCAQCRRELVQNEPVYRVCVCYGYAWPDNSYAVVRSVCAECWSKHFATQAARAPGPCCACGRPVIHSIRRRSPKHFVCSDECRRATYLAEARKRRKLHKRNCDCCGSSFMPARSDARFCSPACKQKAYRQRTRCPRTSAMAAELN